VKLTRWVVALPLGLLMAAPLAAQGAQASPAAVQALHAKYPGVAPVRWKVAGKSGYVAEFTGNGRNIQAMFAAAGTWLESAVEIGAIELPAPVRTAVIRQFAGYQFADTRRVDRATPPLLLYQVRLERPGDIATVRYQADGTIYFRNVSQAQRSAATPMIAIDGTWRGTSTCIAAGTDCRADEVVYRLTAVAGDTTAFDVQMAVITAAREAPMASLPCTLDRSHDALLCTAAHASWRFQVRHDSLIGGLAASDGTLTRRILLKRQP
jgi:hypothetical protein